MVCHLILWINILILCFVDRFIWVFLFATHYLFSINEKSIEETHWMPIDPLIHTQFVAYSRSFSQPHKEFWSLRMRATDLTCIRLRVCVCVCFLFASRMSLALFDASIIRYKNKFLLWWHSILFNEKRIHIKCDINSQHRNRTGFMVSNHLLRQRDTKWFQRASSRCDSKFILVSCKSDRKTDVNVSLRIYWNMARKLCIFNLSQSIRCVCVCILFILNSWFQFLNTNMIEDRSRFVNLSIGTYVSTPAICQWIFRSFFVCRSLFFVVWTEFLIE